MAKFLFLATALLGRMTTGIKLPFMAALPAAPLFFLGFAERTPVNIVLFIASVAVVGYVMAGFYVQSLGGWQELLSLFDRLSQGDLASTYCDSSFDRVAQYSVAHGIAADLNKHFSKIVAQARSVAERITVASKEIASGNINLSQRTEEQASMLEETAAAMEQLSTRVKQNADSCLAAKTLAGRTDIVTAKGGEMVDRLVVTMSLINKTSSRVSDITVVIEGIAFQTNILALNAAVEAERAGQQGRGFAVIASEVRSLAQRSATAAKEIKVLIEESAGNVARGSKLVDETGRMINGVMTSVRKVAQRIAEIAAASEEQSTSVTEINRAIAQLEQVTQQNAARVEETTAAALSLEGEATKLAETVHRFKLAERYEAESVARQKNETGQASGPMRPTSWRISGSSS